MHDRAILWCGSDVGKGLWICQANNEHQWHWKDNSATLLAGCWQQLLQIWLKCKVEISNWPRIVLFKIVFVTDKELKYCLSCWMQKNTKLLALITLGGSADYSYFTTQQKLCSGPSYPLVSCLCLYVMVCIRYTVPNPPRDRLFINEKAGGAPPDLKGWGTNIFRHFALGLLANLK